MTDNQPTQLIAIINNIEEVILEIHGDPNLYDDWCRPIHRMHITPCSRDQALGYHLETLDLYHPVYSMWQSGDSPPPHPKSRLKHDDVIILTGPFYKYASGRWCKSLIPGRWIGPHRPEPVQSLKTAVQVIVVAAENPIQQISPESNDPIIREINSQLDRKGAAFTRRTYFAAQQG